MVSFKSQKIGLKMSSVHRSGKALYPLASDNWDSKEFEAIQQVLDSNHFTMGEQVRIFEENVAKKFGSKFAIMVNSGSSANLVMLTILKILSNQKIKKPNIIVPAVSWSTTYTPAYYLDLELKFCDVDINHFGLNLDSVSKAIDKDTIAILAVNLLGSAADLDNLRNLAKDKNIILLEDNCESLGATLNGEYTGTFGLMASHSSFFSHHINSMEGGWITTDSIQVLDIATSLRAHGWTRLLSNDSEWRKKELSVDWFDAQFEFVLPGLNFRPLEIEAAIANVQLTKVDSMLEIRRKNAQYFKSVISQVQNVQTQSPNGDSSWFAFPLIFESLEKRNLVANKFKEFGIECRPIVTGNFTRQSVLKFLKYRITEDLHNANIIHDNGLYIGNHPHDLSGELDKVLQILKKTV